MESKPSIIQEEVEMDGLVKHTQETAAQVRRETKAQVIQIY